MIRANAQDVADDAAFGGGDRGQDPQGRWDMEAQRFVLYVTDKRPKIKGRRGRQYLVVPDIELATVARLWTALSN
ncbi:MAG: hypothetical protein Q8K93_31895 [Reyranella sp.]|uniref:hypothetical protein n=1 Tax=Reyranella sp. TaxID=1929291 RepID=UPI00272F5D6D|nr:hypothetical protein [Reyranella sp.]MDP1966795.1 hypothetical protein [Reyranella sp.]MDP2372914.1 hypothetical protein [Reyranella sp.]